MESEINLRCQIEPRVRVAIKIIIDYEVQTVEQLKKFGNFTDEECDKAFFSLKKSSYCVVRSLTENNCYFVVKKKTCKEFKFRIKNGFYESGSLYSKSEIINFLKRLCF